MSDLTDEWIEFVRAIILTRCNVPADLVERLTSDDERIQIWNDARSHLTYDSKRNYEILETKGDKMLKSAFSAFLTKKAPGRTPGAYTEWEAYYTENLYFATVCDDLGLTNFLRSRGLSIIEYPIKADMFEAFCGALTVLGDDIHPGLGYNLVFNLVVNIFGGITLDETRALGSEKNRYHETLDKVKARTGPDGKNNLPTYNAKLEGGEHRVTVNLSPKMVDAFRKNEYTDLPYPKEPIGYGANKELALAKREAFRQANEWLEEHGIFYIDLQYQKYQAEFLRAVETEDENIYWNALDKAQEEGYIALAFEMPKKAKSSIATTAILTGVKDDGEIENLVVRLFINSTDASRQTDPDRFRKSLLKIYTNNEPPLPVTIGIPKLEGEGEESVSPKKPKSGLRAPRGKVTKQATKKTSPPKTAKIEEEKKEEEEEEDKKEEKKEEEEEEDKKEEEEEEEVKELSPKKKGLQPKKITRTLPPKTKPPPKKTPQHTKTLTKKTSPKEELEKESPPKAKTTLPKRTLTKKTTPSSGSDKPSPASKTITRRSNQKQNTPNS
jgi:hypothetical protein